MSKPKLPSIKRQIISLLSVLGAGLLFALAIIGYLLYVYGPTGQYKTQNILVEPSLVSKLSYIDTEISRGKEGKQTLDHIQFQAYDEKSGQWDVYLFNDDQYKRFYDLLARDESLFPVPEEVEKQFKDSRLSNLEIIVRPELPGSANEGPAKTFLSVDFIPGTDLYRVFIRTSSIGTDYAYFKHPGVYDQVLKIARMPNEW